MSEVTYYFNAYTTAVWTNPSNMVDGSLNTYGSTSTDGAIQVLTGNDCPGTDLGTITAVEGRIYGYGDTDDQLSASVILGTFIKGGIIFPPGTSPVWSSYFSISVSTWADVVALICQVKFTKVAKGNTMYCAKVEIRVTYTTGAQWSKVAYTSEPPTANAWNQVKQVAGTGWIKVNYATD